MLAHLARARTGRGQHVVVNAQAAMVWTLMNAQAFRSCTAPPSGGAVRTSARGRSAGE
jgi:crotonobetainyl-CoA:carnitine CoA-transferase CaiB-like acyl-CoA transferase